MRRSRAVLLVLPMLAVAACSARGSRPPPGIDVDPVDSGPPAVDAGPSTAPDAGTPPPTDAGSTADDAGMTVDADLADPLAGCDDPVPPLPAEMLPRCAGATRDCVSTCETSECMVSCLAADTTDAVILGTRRIDCEGCIRHQQKHCIDDSGCHAEVGALECCLRMHCPAGGCAECAAAGTAWESCARSTAVGCLDPPIAGHYEGCYGE